MKPVRSHDTANDTPRWPFSPILLYGTFGTRTPAGRRYHVRSGIALVVIVLWAVLAALFLSPGLRGAVGTVTALLPGVAFMYICWEFRRYLSSLDELARRIQLESIAWTYLTGLALAMLIGGIAMLAHWRVNPMWFIVLEPVRAGWLYIVSRRYQ